MRLLTIAANAANAGGLAENSTLLSKSVMKIIKKILDVKISPSDISVTHSIPKPENSISTRLVPVIVRFTKRSIRDYVFHSQFKLKGIDFSFPIYINEDLSAINQKLLTSFDRSIVITRCKASGQPTAKFCAKPKPAQ